MATNVGCKFHGTGSAIFKVFSSQTSNVMLRKSSLKHYKYIKLPFKHPFLSGQQVSTSSNNMLSNKTLLPTNPKEQGRTAQASLKAMNAAQKKAEQLGI